MASLISKIIPLALVGAPMVRSLADYVPGMGEGDGDQIWYNELIFGDCNSYVSWKFADRYHASRGNDLWTRQNLDGTENRANQDAALRKATDYIEKRWGQLFSGSRTTATNSLSYPRMGGRLKDGTALDRVPLAVLYACCEYALIEAQEDLSLLDNRIDRDVGAQSQGVSVLSSSRQYNRNLRGTRARTSNVIEDTTFNEFPAADLLIETLISGKIKGAYVVPIVGGLDEKQRFGVTQYPLDAYVSFYVDGPLPRDGSLTSVF